MSDEISMDGKEYISSKRASELSGYAQDYIGQLARSGSIDAQRVGGLWHVSMASLQNYKEHAETFKPQPPQHAQRKNDPDSLILLDGKDYISASRAAKITGYNQDYVGQLARLVTVPSRQVGNRWYVQREALIEHKNEKDRLLGAVQSQSVGVRRPEPLSRPQDASEKNLIPARDDIVYTYTHEVGGPLPSLEKSEKAAVEQEDEFFQERKDEVANPIPIRIIENRKILDHSQRVKGVKSTVRRPGKTIFYGALVGSALTIVVVLSFGFSTLKNRSTYAVDLLGNHNPVTRNAFTASAAEAFSRIGDLLEKWFVPELNYQRNN
jgi:hypothetical protein